MTAIILPRICDRAAARVLQPEIRDALDTTPVVLDASEVEGVGQAMLQLLVSAAQSEGGIELRNPSEAFSDMLKLAGLETVLGKEIAA